MLWNIVRTVGTTWMFIQLLLAWILLWIIQVIAIVLSFPFTSKTTRSDICGSIHRTVNIIFIVLLNPFWSYKILRKMPVVPPKTKFIVMSNHLSNCDPWFVSIPIWPIDTKWVSKGSLFSVPFGGWGMSNAGDIPVKFTKEKGGWGTEKGSVGKMMDSCKQLVNRFHPFFVFPEGVRNPDSDGPIREFKAGFFEFAVNEGVTIYPIAISGSEKCWPLRGWKFNTGTAYMSCGDPIKPDGHTKESLMAEVYKVMTEMREKHPDRVALKNKKE